MPLIRYPVAGPGVDPALVARVVDAIRSKRVVVLPTETVYGLAAAPGDAAARDRIARLKGRDKGKPLTHHLAARAGFETLAPPPSPRVERLLSRYWPGPLTVIATGLDGQSVGMRVPAQPFTQAVILAAGGDLFLTSVNRSDEEPLTDPDAIAARFGTEIDVLCDAGKSRIKIASTIVDVRREEFIVPREGILTSDEVLATAARTVLFVCSGNTCRSPMAEALAKRLASERLRVPPDRLLARGLRVLSAGTSTLPGMPASEHAESALRELGASVVEHRSRALTRELTRDADVILCMTHGHRQRVLDLDPSVVEKTWLLDPDGEDVQDPFGAELAEYRRTRDAIARRLEQRWDDLATMLRH